MWLKAETQTLQRQWPDSRCISSLDQSSLLDQYFNIDPSGQIFLQKSLSAHGSGAVLTFDVYATDGGGRQTISTVTLTVTATTTVVTTTTTDRWVVYTWMHTPRTGYVTLCYFNRCHVTIADHTDIRGSNCCEEFVTVLITGEVTAVRSL